MTENEPPFVAGRELIFAVLEANTSIFHTAVRHVGLHALVSFLIRLIFRFLISRHGWLLCVITVASTRTGPIHSTNTQRRMQATRGMKFHWDTLTLHQSLNQSLHRSLHLQCTSPVQLGLRAVNTKSETV
jgi:hypothetical protein